MLLIPRVTQVGSVAKGESLSERGLGVGFLTISLVAVRSHRLLDLVGGWDTRLAQIAALLFLVYGCEQGLG